MRTIMLATAAVLALGVGSAFANEDGEQANTFFTELPGVIPQPPAQVPSAVAQNRTGAPTAAFATSHRGVVALFPPNDSNAN